MRFTLLAIFALASSMNFSQAQAQLNKDDFARGIYNKIPGRAETLTRYQGGDVVVGVDIKQKTEDRETFCRKTTAVYPGATSHYSCYSMLLSGDEAREAYETSPNPDFQVLFSIDGHTRVGGAWSEKVVQSQEMNTSLLCVKTHAVVPNPVPTYQCFHEQVPVGGGASIGN